MRSAPRALVVSGVALALVGGSNPPAFADSTGQPSTPPAVVAPMPAEQPAAWPVQPIVGPPETIAGAEAMHFSTATIDGASTEIDGGKTYILKADVLFAYNKAKLTAKARALLRAAAAKIATTSPARIVVTGYTDSAGAKRYNLALSRRRARAVGKYLAKLLPASIVITTRGKGERNPRASNAGKAGRALNRRVEITIPS